MGVIAFNYVLLLLCAGLTQKRGAHCGHFGFPVSKFGCRVHAEKYPESDCAWAS